MTVRERLAQWLAPPEDKAATGIGVQMMTYGPQLSAFARDPRKAMKQAQEVGIANLYVRAAERVIGERFSTIPWHLSDEAGEDYENDAVQRIIERPYMPQPDDPVNSTPQTRSALWRLTSRHLGLCGNAFWYLDQVDALAGWPADVIYINPSRMTPAEDKAGNLLGWVLDADLPGSGVPLERNAVLHFRLEPADTGHYGIGLVESAFSRIEMVKLADRHANDTLAAGGRLAGIFAPSAQSAGSIPEDQYEQLKRDLRNISEDPNAARRALVLKGPIEYTKTTATPTELNLESIASLGKDGILSLWGVPESQLNGAGPGGMNSGETRKYDEASLMQNAVLPRVRAFTETLQYQLLDRIDPNPQLVIEEPTYDDEAPAYDLLSRAINAPMTNAERRAIIGLKPLGSPLDDEVWLPISLQPVTVAPMEAKARADNEAGRTIPGVDRIRRTMTSSISKGLAAVLEAMKAEVSEKVVRNYDHISRKPTDTASWWNEAKWAAEMESIIRPSAALAAEATAKSTADMLGADSIRQRIDSGLVNDLVLPRLLTGIGERIGGINATTRDKISKAIIDGIADGLGAADLGRKVQESSGFGEYRSELIARTETNRLLNASQLETYKGIGIAEVRAIDGDEDEECAARDGMVVSVQEAELIHDHPNGTLDWVPLAFGFDAKETPTAKAAPIMPSVIIHNHPPGVEVGPTFIEPPKVDVQNIVEPTPITVEGPTVENLVATPNVSVAAPTVNVSQPDVTVEAPSVTVENRTEKADTPDLVYVVNMPEPSKVKVDRGPDGRVTGAHQE